PSFAELGFDKLVGLLVICETQSLAVPHKVFVRETPANGAKQHPFRVGSGDAEVRARRLPAFTGADPVLIMTRRTLQDRGRLFVAVNLGTGNGAPTSTATAGTQVALCTNEDLVVTSKILLGQSLWNRKALCQFSLVPKDGDGRHFPGFDVFVG